MDKLARLEAEADRRSTALAAAASRFARRFTPLHARRRGAGPSRVRPSEIVARASRVCAALSAGYRGVCAERRLSGVAVSCAMATDLVSARPGKSFADPSARPQFQAQTGASRHSSTQTKEQKHERRRTAREPAPVGPREGNGQGRFSLARNLNDLGSSAQGAVRSGRQAVSSAYGWPADFPGRCRAPATWFRARRATCRKMVDNNPLIVGVIGIGVGLLLGALMPIGQAAAAACVGAAVAGSRESGRARRKSVLPRQRGETVRRAGGKTPDETAAGTLKRS